MRRQSPQLWMWLVLPLCTMLYQFAAKEIGSCWRDAGVGPALRCMLHASWLPVMVISDIGGFVAWMYVLREMKLSAAYPMSAISYVVVIGGSLLIMAGVYLIGRTDNSTADSLRTV